MQSGAPGIPRLGIPAYDWWNEALHGVARAGIATVFPQAIGLAATWDTDLMHRVADAISDEARAKHHDAVRHGQRGRLPGPDLLVAQHQHLPRSALGPRAGDLRRGSVPHRRAWAWRSSTGCRATIPRYLKVVVDAEALRRAQRPGTRCATASTRRRHERDLRETYLPAFETAVDARRRDSVMCAYNRYPRRACLREPVCCSADPARRVGLHAATWSPTAAPSTTSTHAQGRTPRPPRQAALAPCSGGCDLNCGGELSRPDRRRAATGLLTEARHRHAPCAACSRHASGSACSIRRSWCPGRS